MKPGPRLVCIGNLTLDDMSGPEGTGHADCLGGDALYATLAARLFEPDVAMVAPIGSDLPASAADLMRSAGIDPAAQPQRPLPTIRNSVRYEADGQRSWVRHTSEDAWGDLSVHPEDLTPAHLAAEAIVVSAMTLETQHALVVWLSQQCPATLMVDVREDYDPARRALLVEMMQACDIFLPSEVEALSLAAATDCAEAARTLAALGPRIVVVKRAAQGSLVYEAEHGTLTAVPAVVTDAVDSTGAGDAFCGGFAAVYAGSQDPVLAARAGTRAAALAISDYGNRALLAVSPGSFARSVWPRLRTSA